MRKWALAAVVACCSLVIPSSASAAPKYCGTIAAPAGNARLPVMVLRGMVSCSTARYVLIQDLFHGHQFVNGWFCADDTGARLAIGKVEHCRYPGGAPRSTKFVQAYDPNEFNPDQH
jgi:hypothetical protein